MDKNVPGNSEFVTWFPCAGVGEVGDHGNLGKPSCLTVFHRADVASHNSGKRLLLQRTRLIVCRLRV